MRCRATSILVSQHYIYTSCSLSPSHHQGKCTRRRPAVLSQGHLKRTAKPLSFWKTGMAVSIPSQMLVFMACPVTGDELAVYCLSAPNAPVCRGRAIKETLKSKRRLGVGTKDKDCDQSQMGINCLTSRLSTPFRNRNHKERKHKVQYGPFY